MHTAEIVVGIVDRNRVTALLAERYVASRRQTPGAFERNPALKKAAYDAQSAAGVVAERLSHIQTGNEANEEAVFNAELRKSEATLKAAFENLLGKTISLDNNKIVSAAQRSRRVICRPCALCCDLARLVQPQPSWYLRRNEARVAK
jgi:hypothetical protein